MTLNGCIRFFLGGYPQWAAVRSFKPGVLRIFAEALQKDDSDNEVGDEDEDAT